MNAAPVLLLLFASTWALKNSSSNNDDDCKSETMPQSVSPTWLNSSVSHYVNEILAMAADSALNFSHIAQKVLSKRSDIFGVFLTSATKMPMLALNLQGKMNVFPNKTSETEVFWEAYHSATLNGWTPPFRDCSFLYKTWLHLYVIKTSRVGVGLFLPMKMDHCDDDLVKFTGGAHKCDRETTIVSIHFQISNSFSQSQTGVSYQNRSFSSGSLTIYTHFLGITLKKTTSDFDNWFKEISCDL